MPLEIDDSANVRNQFVNNYVRSVNSAISLLRVLSDQPGNITANIASTLDEGEVAEIDAVKVAADSALADIEVAVPRFFTEA